MQHNYFIDFLILRLNIHFSYYCFRLSASSLIQPVLSAMKEQWQIPVHRDRGLLETDLNLLVYGIYMRI